MFTTRVNPLIPQVVYSRRPCNQMCGRAVVKVVEQADGENKKVVSGALIGKDLLEILDLAFSVIYKFSIGVGAILIVVYLSSMGFYPAFSASEVVFLVFLTMMFGFVFTLTLMYGALGCLWIVTGVEAIMRMRGRLRENPGADRRKKFRSQLRKAKAKKRSISLSIRKRLRKVFKTDQRGKAPVRSLRPEFAKGWMPFLMSILVFGISGLVFFELAETRRLFIGAAIAGFTLILVAGSVFRSQPATTRGSRVESRAVAKFFAWGLLASTTVYAVFAGFSTQLDIVMSQLGMRSISATVEVSEGETARLMMISDALSFPVVDCRKASSGRILAHYATVPWHGVGEKSRLEFNIPGEKERMPGLAGERPWKHAAVSVDASQTTVIDTNPRLARCLPYSTKAMYGVNDAEFSEFGKRALESMLRVLSRDRSADSAHIMIYVDHESDKALAQERSDAIAQQLRRISAEVDMKITTQVKKGSASFTLVPGFDIEIWIGRSGLLQF